MSNVRLVRRALRSVLVPLAATGLVVAACGDQDETAQSGVSGDVVVFAAASLTDSFTEIGEAFMAAHPDADVTLSFAASSDLVAQLNEGAPADVFASADQNNMTKLTDAAGDAGAPQIFVKNSLQVAVEAGNPLGITGVADLADSDLILVTTDPEVPIGAYSQEVFANAGVTVTPDSLEENVRAVLDKVALGEADAGVVYATDVLAVGDTVTGVEIPADVNVTPEYPIVATAAAPNPDCAATFVEFVLGVAGQEILQRYGFLAP
ncbi:MAG: molybdate ABC transporter substrate-binding protein [Acidimicrobiia bacterium]|nr:molybdate ABC transporter substrate-binding protein [Acidimicrobiia bacterium]